MTPENIFQYTSTLALAGWILLIISYWFNIDKWIAGIIITLLCIVYMYLVITNFDLDQTKNFSSLQGVKLLFSNDSLLLAGWVHYLAFDLLTGLFIKNNAIKCNISFWVVLPCLFFTFMLGPVGLLLYFIFRMIITKKYFHSYL
jgi:hypothetical protein